MRVRREGALVRATLSRPPVNALNSAAYRWLVGQAVLRRLFPPAMASRAFLAAT